MICIGPVSNEVIEATFQCSQEHKKPFSLIASKSQVDYNKGYVNNWNTAQYVDFVGKMKKKHPKADVQVCRDHCGPGFNGNFELSDVYETIRTDIECGFDLLHIDFCHHSTELPEIVAESMHAIEYAQKLNSKIKFEIGTDEISAPFDFKDFKKNLKTFLQICTPVFYVVNTGSLVKEDGNVGHFNTNNARQAYWALFAHGIRLKEHNADYLSKNDLGKRRFFIDSMNIAPELGVNQTRKVLSLCEKYSIDTSDFLETSYNSEKWTKWIYKTPSTNFRLMAELAGHYNYTSDEYLKIYESLSKKTNVYKDLVDCAKETINRYEEFF